MSRFAQLLLLSMILASCTTTREITGIEVQNRQPSPLRTVLEDGGTIRFTRYVLTDNALIGIGERISTSGNPPFQGAIPLPSVIRYEVEYNHTWVMVLLGAGAAVILAQELLTNDQPPSIPITPIR